jgi:hypothetical protein
MIDIDVSELPGPLLHTVRRPSRVRTVRPSRVSSRNLAPGWYADGLLDAYSSWLFFERHFLHIGRFGVAKALGMIDTVATNNVGAAFHLLSSRDLPDYAGPARRAALVLAAAGLEVDRLTRLTPEVR